MKLIKLAVLPLTISLFMLASCQPDKQGGQPGFKSSNNNSTSTSIDTLVGQTLYSLTVVDGGYHIIYGPFRPSTDMEVVEYDFPYNAWVIFKLARLNDADYVITLNEERLVSYEQDNQGYFYQFYMPAKDSVLTVTVQNAFFSID